MALAMGPNDEEEACVNGTFLNSSDYLLIYIKIGAGMLPSQQTVM